MSSWSMPSGPRQLLVVVHAHWTVLDGRWPRRNWVVKVSSCLLVTPFADVGPLTGWSGRRHWLSTAQWAVLACLTSQQNPLCCY